MIDCKTGDVIGNNERVDSANFDGNISLTWLWEVIVRTKRLPDNLDPKVFFVVLRDRLRNPEREVRLHALRVLADLIPILEPQDLDKQMKVLMQELINNLTYTAPAVRKGTVDVFRIYFKTTPHPNENLKEILTTITDDNYLKLGIILAVPSFINHHISEDTLTFILQQLYAAASHQLLQEAALNSLVKIRKHLGHDKFEKLAGFKLFQEIVQLCDQNNIVLEDSNVILETEIMLDTGPAITMKIHEEETCTGSEEEIMRSPRKVRFGGEVVKMRTPESDSNQGSDTERRIMVINRPTSIKITVAENVGLKTTHRSQIPIRIKTSSQPCTPKKMAVKRLSRSAPDLGRIQSKIPLKIKKVKTPPPSSRTDEFSPIPVHNEIEVFHNLTRSPTRVDEQGLKTSNSAPNLTQEITSSSGTIKEIGKTHRGNYSANINTSTISKDYMKPVIDTGVFYRPKKENSARNVEKQQKIENRPKSIMKEDKRARISPGDKFFGVEIKEDAVKCKNSDKEEKTTKFLPVLVQDDSIRPSSTRQEGRHMSRRETSAQINNGGRRTPLITPQMDGSNFGSPVTDQYESFKVFENVQKDNTFQSFKVCDKASLTPVDNILHDLIHEEDIWKKNRLLDQLQLLLPHPRSSEIFDALLNMDQHPRLSHKIQRILNRILDQNHENIPEKLISKLVKIDDGVNLALKLYQKYSPNSFFQQLPNVPLNENSLKILIGIVRTFPRSEVDVFKAIEYGAVALNDDRRKVRQAALEALAALAQLSNNATVLDAVAELNSDQVLRVVRTRLSRRQLPAVDVNGNVRYSSPKEQEEFDWLCGGWNNEPASEDQIWTFDSNSLPKIERVYVVPGDKIYRRYDRGRSNSPPRGSSVKRNEFGRSQQFRKSFSSEQIYRSSNKTEPTSYSLSSRSSTTSTGSSKSGVWFKSNIPVPVFDKLKIRHRPEGHNGPLLATQRKTTIAPVPEYPDQLPMKLDSPQVTHPVITRLSPSRPPPSSGSESSGYFTPPAEHPLKDPTPERYTPDKTRFIPETERFIQESDDHMGRFISEDERFQETSQEDEPTEDRFIRDAFQQSEARFVQQDSFQESEPRTPPHNNFYVKDKPVNLARELSVSSISDTGDQLEKEVHSTGFDVVDNRSFASPRLLSKSEANLKTTLPEIPRKNISSAPPRNDIVTIVPYPETLTSPKTALPGSCNQETPKKKEHTPKRLLRRSVSQKVTTCKPEKPQKPDRTKDNLQLALQQMDSSEWETVMLGLNNLIKLSRNNTDTLEADMHAVCVILAKNIKNLRSQVARNACKVSSEMFATCKKQLEMELEELAGPLLHRTADTNKFLRSDANAALDSMAVHLPVSRVVAVIANKGATHQNGVVRATSTRILSEMANHLGADKVFQLPKETRDRFLMIGANGLTEGSLESRKYAKTLLTTLANHPHFHKALTEVVPQHTLRHISKIINSLK